jgi:MFS family permease
VLLFLAFNMFWTAAPLELAGRFGLGQDGIALFALAGAGGALAAPLAGRFADRGHGRFATAVAIVGTCAALLASGWIVPAGALAGFWLCALAMDAMVQTNQVVGQRALYQLSESARGRINALYMTVVFCVGGFGPILGTVLHARFGWHGPALGGAAFAGAAVLLWLAAQCVAANRPRQ